ncbi:MAG TPA: DUF1990 domain-containing protein [Candidatus Tumulicola sp.]
MTSGLTAAPPAGFAHDRSTITIGSGVRAFAVAREAISHWSQFDLGWVRVVNPPAAIVIGQLVGVEAHTAFLWSLNFCRIVEVVDEPFRFGFVYATTTVHVERGEERFLIELDPATDALSYTIEAISRPDDPLARIALPYARATQRRFVRESIARLHDIVER